MIENLKISLSNLEASFMTNAREVQENSKLVDNELINLKKLNKKITKTDKIEDLINLIEKLSIQNDFKLNLVKDFSSYISNKK